MGFEQPALPSQTTPATVGVQSVLYNNDFNAIERSISALARSATLAKDTCTRLTVYYGDSSPERCLSDTQIETLRSRFGDLIGVEYDFFQGNLGSAKGHNRLAESNTATMFLIQNPDVIVAPRLIETLLAEFSRSDIGMAEAKQLPIEHPKDYDTTTGETGWATTACAMIPSHVFQELHGFDDETFFLYCDDVDFSWRVRLAGLKVIFQPAAFAFHDKRLSETGSWQPSSAEQYYSAEAALLLSYKWSRADLTGRIARRFSQSEQPHLLRAVQEFERRRLEQRLPVQIDPDHRIGNFTGDFYAHHRFAL